MCSSVDTGKALDSEDEVGTEADVATEADADSMEGVGAFAFAFAGAFAFVETLFDELNAGEKSGQPSTPRRKLPLF